MKKLIVSLIAVGFLLIASSALAFDFGQCVNTINKKVNKVQGFDPRVLARTCAWNMVIKGKGGKYFKQCMVSGLKRNVRNLKNPEQFANNIYTSIKKKCS